MMHVQSGCFSYKTYYFFDVLDAVRVVGSLKSLLLKLPTVEIQKFCYHGNVTSHFSSLLMHKNRVFSLNLEYLTSYI